VKIPLNTVSEAALAGIVEDFVLREGTDYGPGEHGFASKCAEVRAQLANGEAAINFDPVTGTIDIRLAIQSKRGKQDDR
jgi:uncharacterized protein YheU (UPF0270 family)